MKRYNLVSSSAYKVHYFLLLGFVAFSLFSFSPYLKKIIYIVYFFSTIFLFIRHRVVLGAFEKATLVILFFYPVVSSAALYINHQNESPIAYLSQYIMTLFFILSANFLYKDYLKIVDIIMSIILLISIVLLTLNVFLLLDIGTYNIHQIFSGVKGVIIDEYVGMRPAYQPIVAKIYFITTLLFVVSGVYYLFMSRIQTSLLILLALLVLGSRWTVITMLMFYFIYFLWYSNLKNRILMLIYFLVIVFLLIWLYPNLIERVFLSLDFGKASSGISIRDIIVSEVFNDLNAFSFLFGSGSGSSFYSDFRSSYVMNTEVSHVELIRRFGIIWFISFNLYLIYVLTELKRCNLRKTDAILMSVVAFYISSLSNPVLMHPIFILLVIFSGVFARNYNFSTK